MAETITMPKLGFDMQEGTLVRWLRTEGESVNKGEVLAEIETDKATVEVESSASGIVRKLLVGQGTVVPIGAPIAIVGTAEEKLEVPADRPAPSAPAPVAPTPAAQPAGGTRAATQPNLSDESPKGVAGIVKASPLARKLAGDARLDLVKIQGTGPGGRIVRKDVEAALTGRPLAGRLYAAPAMTLLSKEDSTVALSRLRLAIGRRMAESKSTVPHFYVTHEYRVDSLVDLRQQANSRLPEDQRLSVNDFVVKAVAECLRDFPNLNAAYQGDRVVRRGSINVGVAVAVEGGLLTVVCKDADQKPLRQISTELRAMAEHARSGRVRQDDIEGSTFTVSNLGMFDVENFLAIINPPEAAILAVGSARQVPVVDNGEIKPGWRMKATIAVDHRVSDGAEAAQFMQSLAGYIEKPVTLFL